MVLNRRDGLKAKLDWRYWPSTPALANFDTSALLEHARHPELEDHQHIAWGLAQCEGTAGKVAAVDVLDVVGTDVTWKSGIRDDELEKMTQVHRKTAEAPPPARSLSVFFLSTLESRAGWLPGNFSICARTLRILQQAGLSSTILDTLFAKEGVWSKMGNQCFTENDANGALDNFEMCYRYVCGWDTGFGFTQLLRTRSQTIYFCINYPSQALKRFKMYLDRDVKFAYRGFFLDALSADECLREWQLDIGERRRRLLEHERSYSDNIDFNEATKQLHKLSYDWNTLSQDCRDQGEQLAFLSRTYEKYMRRLCDAGNAWDVDKSHDMRETFEVLKSQCDNHYRWTQVYKERTNIRINLLFHLSAQRESRTSTQIAASNAIIAEQTQRDSASMITMAAVTMLFLPGTFISAILSTTFFDYGDDGLSVSRKWWILPASTIPTTIGVFAVWLAWR
ncbi:hypothetical protein P171DRAFT_359285 [Karstenula rhodostoma CBS 690.94]|uniref:Cora-domain-containing protein n=1 Tax=Karstenula rhodostoma CBS 690.94 TaxID=1392251 RepID=A0A9P4PLL5_9PLEO|nr:hypothetical protein P171DRAFT_359285 [Karstenula rhodostoma CBS 690.94]